FVVSPELSVDLYYPAKDKGERVPMDRSKGPAPLVLFTPDAEEGPYKLCEWMAQELSARGFVTAVLPPKAGGEEPARLMAVREALLKRNADKNPAWKGAVNPARVIVVGHGSGAAAALAAGADATKVAGVILLSPPSPLKPPDKYKGATLIVGGEEGQEAATKTYGDCRKPRYLYSVAGLDQKFMPPEKAGKAFGIVWAWLSWRYFDRDELKSMVSGQDAAGQLKSGELKLFKVDE
ncbi:MAG TPA: hypothetical protein VE981_17355, partial [Planctomycetota bacterium]|nr:hypothetical protein [Planctomycetota bacterium]